MRVAVCDDDGIYAQEVMHHVQLLISDKKIPAQFDLFDNSSDLYNNAMYYDVAFLDIEMLPYNGIETAKKLKSINPNIIIFFITSYEKYLDDAMDLNAFRYIKKPLDVRRLNMSLEKALKLIDNSQISFFLKNGKETVSIASNDIIYIEIVNHSTKVVSLKGIFISDNSMDFWSNKLIASFFYRVHKSFIINMKYITNYTRAETTLCGQYKIPIAYRKQAEFRSYILSYFGE